MYVNSCIDTQVLYIHVCMHVEFMFTSARRTAEASSRHVLSGIRLVVGCRSGASKPQARFHGITRWASRCSSSVGTATASIATVTGARIACVCRPTSSG